jgi:hypothetical protein
MIINIHYPQNNKHIKYSINHNMSISNIKNDINKLINNDIELVYLNSILDNNDYLHNYDISDFSNIFVFEKMFVNIKIDLSLYVNKKIVIKVLNNIYVYDLKKTLTDYLLYLYPFLIINNIILFINDTELLDEHFLFYYNLLNDIKIVF